MRISDWSSDVCSSDLRPSEAGLAAAGELQQAPAECAVAARPAEVARAVVQVPADRLCCGVGRLREDQRGGGGDEGSGKGGAAVVAAALAPARAPDIDAGRVEIDADAAVGVTVGLA